MQKLLFIATVGLLIGCSGNSDEKVHEQIKLEKEQRIHEAELEAEMQRSYHKTREIDSIRKAKDELELERLKSSTVTIGDLEVMTNDIKQMNWEWSVNYAKKIGDGWRLPTLAELKILHDNQDIIGGFHTNGISANYWSSEKVDSDVLFEAWLICFNKKSHHTLKQDGEQFTASTSTSDYHVRLVRNIEVVYD